LEVQLSSFHWNVKFTVSESDPITVAGLSFHFVIIPLTPPITVPLV